MFKSSIVLFLCWVGLNSAQGFTENYIDEYFGSTEYSRPDIEPSKYLVFFYNLQCFLNVLRLCRKTESNCFHSESYLPNIIHTMQHCDDGWVGGCLE